MIQKPNDTNISNLCRGQDTEASGQYGYSYLEVKRIVLVNGYTIVLLYSEYDKKIWYDCQ